MVSYAAVITNGHIRELVPFNNLPDEVKGDFDYVHMDERWDDRFVRYGGEWHDVMDAQRIDVTPSDPNIRTRIVAFGFNVAETSPLNGWDAIATTSVWTGTVFRWMTDSEAYERDLLNDRYGYIICGRYVA